MRNPKIHLVLPGLVLSAVLGLSACTAAPAAVPTGSPSEAVVETPDAAPAAIDESSVRAGDTVDFSTANALNANKDSDTVVYKTSDGKYIVVKKEKPLPAVVAKDVKKAAKPIAAPFAKTSMNLETSRIQIAKMLKFLGMRSEKLADRTLLVVFLAYSDVDGLEWATLYSTGSGSTGISAGSKSTTVAKAKVWAARLVPAATVLVLD